MTTSGADCPGSTPAGVYGPRGLALRCLLEGREAGAAGSSWRACPYSTARGFSLRWWLKGYVRGRDEAGLPLPGEGVMREWTGRPVLFEEARSVVDRAVRPWPAELGELYVAPDGFEDERSWQVIAGAREYLVGGDVGYALLDWPALLVDKVTGRLERVVVIESFERLGAMRAVRGTAPTLRRKP